ncbi:AraC family transcriptional regulator [Bacteroides sp. 51]|uniref:helix-turn-helix domain-containing protein n=1 Tax=Bacteroides sp. 51 TaxID=2302938 RepID=UPI0013D42400|nr:AraC family transcriptional regulator [Bacteroides sp. 51]NDV83803.1 AraC family transcriptional regulator [Bacteroides sp. 51]
METEIEVLTFILYFTICAFFFCSVLLWMRRETNGKSRRYLALTTLASGGAFLLRLLLTKTGVPPSPTILPIANLHLGLLTMLLLYLYPIEAISPGWLTWKRIILLFLPWVFITLLLVVLPIQFRTLSSFGEIWEYVGEFNVWFRLFILLIIVPYSFMLFYIPHNWMKSSVSYRWIYFYTIGVQVITALFTAFMLTCSVTVSICHLLYCMFFILVVTYQDLFLRIEVPVKQSEAVPVLVTVPVVPVEKETPSDPLLIQLNAAMDNDELWRNPDLDLEKLSNHLYTNRTTLTQLIQQEGHSGYREFINRRRVDEFLKVANSGKVTNVQDTFFDVGFRSKMTALRYFRKYTGTTPTEYIRKLIENELK